MSPILGSNLRGALLSYQNAINQRPLSLWPISNPIDETLKKDVKNANHTFHPLAVVPKVRLSCESNLKNLSNGVY